MIRRRIVILSQILSVSALGPALGLALGTAVLTTGAAAQEWRGTWGQEAFRSVAQEVIRDDEGRHFLVDRRTGRVIKRLWPEDEWPGPLERAPDLYDDEATFDAPRSRRYLDDDFESRFERRERRRAERRLERQLARERERQLERRRFLRERARLLLEEEQRQAERPWKREWLPENESSRYEAPRYDDDLAREEERPSTRRPSRGESVSPRVRPVLPKPRQQALAEPSSPSLKEIPVERRALPPLEGTSAEENTAEPEVVQPDLVRPELEQPGQSAERETEIASLPDVSAPIPSVEPIPSLAKPAYGPTRMMELQIMLDRAGFSPGVIDGQWGTNVEKALKAYTRANGKAVDLRKPDQLAKALIDSGGPAVVSKTLTVEDVSGPFVSRIPIDYARKAEMPAMSYTSVTEKLAEAFHVSEALLASLNPGKAFRAGETIRVPSVGQPVARKVHYLVADKEQKQVRAYDRNGKLVAAYPATIGSQATPSPSGTHTIERIAFDPQYTYDPTKNFKQGTNDKVLVVPPGPNGPVGSVWIALSKESYGIHGTPRPDQIGKTNSNGCIRLTNWDAQELARLVRKGVAVEFRG